MDRKMIDLEAEIFINGFVFYFIQNMKVKEICSYLRSYIHENATEQFYTAVAART